LEPCKKEDRDDKLAHHDEFTAELQMLSSQQADSLNLDKSLQAQIKTLRDNQNQLEGRNQDPPATSRRREGKATRVQKSAASR
jgi:hypothetical protein